MDLISLVQNIEIGQSLMQHQFEFAVIITIQLGLMAGVVAHFDTMEMKDRIKNKKREVFGGIS